MGEGHYTMIAFGTREVPAPPAEPPAEQASEWYCRSWYGWDQELQNLSTPRGLQLCGAYQSQPYLAIPLAVSNSRLEDRLGCPVKKMNGTAWRFATLSEMLEPYMGPVRKLWAEAQAEVAQLGRTLPDGELLIISDYD